MDNWNSEKRKEFFQALLNEAKTIKDRFNGSLPEAEKQIIAKNFQNEILSILDYMYTNFPTDRKSLGNTFPRPFLGESEHQYLEKVKKFEKKGRKHSKEVIEFLNLVYSLNNKYRFAISYIRGKVKHETPNQFDEKSQMKLNAKVTSNHPKPIKTYPDGSIQIGAFRIGVVGGKVGEEPHVMIKNSVFSTGNHHTIVHELVCEEKFDGDIIVFINNGKQKKFKFKEWADDCINICSTTLEEFLKLDTRLNP